MLLLLFTVENKVWLRLLLSSHVCVRVCVLFVYYMFPTIAYLPTWKKSYVSFHVAAQSSSLFLSSFLRSPSNHSNILSISSRFCSLTRSLSRTPSFVSFRFVQYKTYICNVRPVHMLNFSSVFEIGTHWQVIHTHTARESTTATKITLIRFDICLNSANNAYVRNVHCV